MQAVADTPAVASWPGQWISSPPAYHWHTPHLTSWVGKDLPANLPALVYAKIGSTALQRLNDFRRWPAGWNNGSGDEIAWGTLQNFEGFLEPARFHPGKPPSLFLTNMGHLELVWDGRDCGEITVAFTPAGATYFFAATEEEGAIPADQLGELAARAAGMTL